MVCKKCGTENGERNVCTNCGNFIAKNQTQRETDPEKVKKIKKKRTWANVKSILLSVLLFLAVMLILGVLIFGILYIFFKFGGFSL